MIETSPGIILRTRPLTETSLIVHWLTPALGRVATVAKGARRAKSVFRGKIDLFYSARFSFARSRRSELHTLREIILDDPHEFLRRDVRRLQQASYCALLIEKTTEVETPIQEVYFLFKTFLEHLSQNVMASAVLSFELRLLEILGLSPHLENAQLSAGSTQIARRLSADDWAALENLKLTPAQQQEIRQFLHGFIIYHLGSIPKGRAEALQTAREEVATQDK